MTTLIRSLVLTCAATVAIVLTASVVSAEQITVTTYGVWATEMKACMLDPFTQATGITVVADPGASGVNLSKLIQEKSDPAHDVAWIDSGVSELAWNDGVIDTIDPTAVPNIANLANVAIDRTKDGKIFALSTGIYVTAIEYNTKTVKQPPTSWWDLWKPEYEHRVSYPSPAMGNFVPLFMFLNKQLGGNSTNFEPIVAKLSSLKPYSFYDAGAILNAAFQADEVSLAPFYGNNAWLLSDKGMSMLSTVPKEGTVAGDIRVHLVKGTKHREAALKFINFVISPEALTCLSDKLYLGIPLQSPKLSDKTKARMPWGPNGSIKDLQFPDWNEVNAKQAEIIDLWNRRVVGK